MKDCPPNCKRGQPAFIYVCATLMLRRILAATLKVWVEGKPFLWVHSLSGRGSSPQKETRYPSNYYNHTNKSIRETGWKRQRIGFSVLLWIGCFKVPDCIFNIRQHCTASGFITKDENPCFQHGWNSWQKGRSILLALRWWPLFCFKSSSRKSVEGSFDWVGLPILCYSDVLSSFQMTGSAILSHWWEA